MSNKKRLKTREDFEQEYYDYMKQIFKDKKIPSPKAWWISDKVENGSGFFADNEVTSVEASRSPEPESIVGPKTVYVPFDIDNFFDTDPAPKGVKKIRRVDSDI